MKKFVALFMVFILVALQVPTTSVNAEVGSILWDGSVASSYGGGVGSPEDPFLIANGGQLARMAQEVNNGNEINYNYKLTKDIDLGSLSWVPIGNEESPFKGNFNGNNYSISNMKVGYIQNLSRGFRNEAEKHDGANRSQGIEALYDPVIEALEGEIASINEELERAIAVEAETGGKEAINQIEVEASEESLALEGPVVSEEEASANSVSSEETGVIRAAIEETTNLVESSAIEQKNAPRNFSIFTTDDQGYEGDAGLFGYFDSGMIEKVTVRDSQVTGQGYTGGIVGYSGVNAVIDYCYFDGTVDNSVSGSIGGIVGYADGRVSNCVNTGTIGNVTRIGSFIGGIAGVSKNHISSSRNSGTILGKQSFIGGIVGKLEGSQMIMYCFNNGNIGTTDVLGGYVGGIVGRGPNGYVNKSANHGKITSNPTSDTAFIGGLAGNIHIITTSYNTGAVSGYGASGLSGVIIGGSLKNYNAGQISGDRNAAITYLLDTMGTVGRNSTYWRNGSAAVAIRSDAAYPYGGSPIRVEIAVMQSTPWIGGTLGSPFMTDSYLRNNRYPVLEGIEYGITFPQSPGVIETGTFIYGGHREKDSPDIKKDYTETYHYSDSYFGQKASFYNPSLATMSMCLVMSGFNSNNDATTLTSDENSNYREKYKNAEKLLTDTGFIEIEANEDYKRKPTENSFGVITGHKELNINGQKKTLIALVGRGVGYGLEWSGNFVVGGTGEHEGFVVGRDIAYNWLSDYINEHRDDPSFHEEDVMFWITGYSRAAGVTNLLAGKMTTDLSIAGIEYSNEDLYAYCLAPPMGGLANVSEVEDKVYTNIHNIVNPNDFVPKVAPAAWEFTRYGVDEPVIPDRLITSNSEIFTEMYGKLDKLKTDWSTELLKPGATDYVLNDFQGKRLKLSQAGDPGSPGGNLIIENSDIAMSKFLDLTMDLVANSIGDRETYVENFQETISDLGGRALGDPEEVELWKTTIPQCINKVFEEHFEELEEILSGSKLNALSIAKASNLVIDYTLVNLEEEGIDISRELLADTLGLLLKTLFGTLYSSGGSDVMTFFSNMNLLALPHYPELYFAWMQAHDPNYDGTPETYINTYRIASISGDADVSVYDSKGALVAQIKDDLPEKIGDSTIVASMNDSNEKNIYLPADETYDIKVLAKGEGELNYAVREYSGDTASYAKMVNYYDIPVTSGDRLEGMVPRFSSEDVGNLKNGSNATYTLDNAENTLTPSLEVKGEVAREALYDVNVTSSIEGNGLAFGTGKYCEGSMVQITAIPFEGKRFIGWYQGDALISTDGRYEFMVTQGANFTAVFE